MTALTLPQAQSLDGILSRADIRTVWAALGGPPLKHGRGRAFWRDGDGLNVALYPDTNTWHDFPRGEGGGLLALIQKSEGGSRGEAAERLAEIYSARLDRSPRNPARVAERHRARRQRQQLADRRKEAARQLRERAASDLRSERRASNSARENMETDDELHWEAVWISVQRGRVAMHLLQLATALEDGLPGDAERTLARAYLIADAPLEVAQQLVDDDRLGVSS